MSELENFLGLTAGFQLWLTRAPLLNYAWDKLACNSTEQDDLIPSETHIRPFFYNTECILLFSTKCSFWMDEVQDEALVRAAWCSLVSSLYAGS